MCDIEHYCGNPYCLDAEQNNKIRVLEKELWLIKNYLKIDIVDIPAKTVVESRKVHTGHPGR